MNLPELHEELLTGGIGGDDGAIAPDDTDEKMRHDDETPIKEGDIDGDRDDRDRDDGGE